MASIKTILFQDIEDQAIYAEYRVETSVPFSDFSDPSTLDGAFTVLDITEREDADKTKGMFLEKSVYTFKNLIDEMSKFGESSGLEVFVVDQSNSPQSIYKPAKKIQNGDWSNDGTNWTFVQDVGDPAITYPDDTVDIDMPDADDAYRLINTSFTPNEGQLYRVYLKNDSNASFNAVEDLFITQGGIQVGGYDGISSGSPDDWTDFGGDEDPVEIDDWGYFFGAPAVAAPELGHVVIHGVDTGSSGFQTQILDELMIEAVNTVPWKLEMDETFIGNNTTGWRLVDAFTENVDPNLDFEITNGYMRLFKTGTDTTNVVKLQKGDFSAGKRQYMVFMDVEIVTGTVGSSGIGVGASGSTFQADIEDLPNGMRTMSATYHDGGARYDEGIEIRFGFSSGDTDAEWRLHRLRVFDVGPSGQDTY